MPTTIQPAELGSATVFRTHPQDIAAHLRSGADARACYLLLADGAPDAPGALISSAAAPMALDEAEIRALLQRTLETAEPLELTLGGRPALALPLISDGEPSGAALLLFGRRAVIESERIAGIAALAAAALAGHRQLQELKRQSEQIVERTRLREIQISRNLIRGVIDSVPMGLALLDPDGTVLAVNRALAERFGLEPAALVGASYDSVIGPWKDSTAARTFASAAPERTRRTMTGPNNVQVLLEITSIPLLDPGGQPHQVVEVWENITERVALQTQLVRAEKLAAIGQLAASIAHEVGNPLQAIQGFLSLFLEQCPPDIDNQHFLKLAEEEIDRIVQVLARLRDLYRPRADVVTPSDLNALISAVILLTSKQLERARIHVRQELTPGLPKIDLVADQIKQVLLNLVLNAADAMSEGGILHIQTYLHHDRSGKRFVTMTITDTGVGIAPDQLPHIFDGLHTTKERGMGLGLYTSKAIIDRHMGRISVQSTLGEGTTFTIMLPVSDET